MGRKRLRNYRDIYLTKDDLKKLKHGHGVMKQVKGVCVLIQLQDWKRDKEVTKLKQRIYELTHKK